MTHLPREIFNSQHLTRY